MNQILSYSGLVTKVKAMRSHLLTAKQFEELANCPSVSEAAAYLKQNPGYQKALENFDATILHRGIIEQALKQSIFRDFSKLYHFCNGKQRKFLDLYAIRYETAFLKQCLRTIYDENPLTFSDETGKWFFESYFSFPIAPLANASTIRELIDGLKGSAYYKLLHQIYTSSKENLTLFDYETALDYYYFCTTWNSYNKLFTGNEKKALIEAFGTKLDMLNIQWIYRSKKYYSMSPADIIAILLPAHYKLKPETLSAMVHTETIEELIELISSTCYGRQFRETDPITLEKAYNALLSAAHKAALRKYPYSIACVNTYLYEKEHEADRLTTAIEGIRYGLGYNEILSYIS
ncbi:MAG: V-type ATPase subunit [Lachnospiraceae bacterium]|nr:V-type ATPase subunit [Lachnospiraceae bacterium]